ncbi:hypothetical protein [Aeromonas caviae]|uniref:hypothetical protein n=1 Tax=Aeromonas TaxID=642 RepID=UPI00111AE694|nr:hypothetical protein [Aeromonas caviae]
MTSEIRRVARWVTIAISIAREGTVQTEKRRFHLTRQSWEMVRPAFAVLCHPAAMQPDGKTQKLRPHPVEWVGESLHRSDDS